ncbi:hypothetical protein [Citrobacter amalonaticus]|uniref:hypothetical protein n=1 Tax=Citrobacter amalonaticus TaxID=35703 RepID=UPI003B6364A1
MARSAERKTTQEEGQERQEAKTQDCQDDKRPETLVYGNGKDTERSRLKEKQGVLRADKECRTRSGS